MNRIVTTLVTSACVMLVTGCSTQSTGTGALGSQGSKFMDPTFSLVAEVDYVVGKMPDPKSRDFTTTIMAEIADKDGAELILGDELEAKGAEYEYTIDEIREIEATHRQSYEGGGSVAVYFLFLDGRYSGDTDSAFTLGIAYSGSSLVIFKDNIKRLCDPLRTQYTNEGKDKLADLICPLMEGTTWVHELGHLFGLVNTGAEMVAPHQDEDHGAHCDDAECVMYWLNNSLDLAEIIKSRLDSGNEDFFLFDQNCLDDLNALNN